MMISLLSKHASVRPGHSLLETEELLHRGDGQGRRSPVGDVVGSVHRTHIQCLWSFKPCEPIVVMVDAVVDLIVRVL